MFFFFNRQIQYDENILYDVSLQMDGGRHANDLMPGHRKKRHR